MRDLRGRGRSAPNLFTGLDAREARQANVIAGMIGTVRDGRIREAIVERLTALLISNRPQVWLDEQNARLARSIADMLKALPPSSQDAIIQNLRGRYVAGAAVEAR